MCSLKYALFEPIDLKNNASAISVDEILLDKIISDPNQPRQKFDETALNEMAQSIKKHGVIQPIIVKQLADSQYQIIAGERRWRASKLADLRDIPAIIQKYEAKNNLAISLIENIQREGLNSIELAEAFYRLNVDYGLSHEAIANLVGKRRTTVSNLLRLLNLSGEVKELVVNGQLEMGHARAILSLNEENQIDAANKIVEKKMTVRGTESYVRLLQTSSESQETVKEFDPGLFCLEEDLCELLGLVTKIQVNAKGKGRMICFFPHIDDVKKLIKQLRESMVLADET